MTDDVEDNTSRSFTISGRPLPAPGERPRAMYNAISPDYFRVMQIPLLKGRYLTEKDVEASPWVVIVNEAAARKFWPNQDPLGQVVTLDFVRDEQRPREVIGVVGSVRQWSLAEEPQPEIYISYLQQPGVTPSNYSTTRLHKSLVVRTSFLSKGLADSIYEAVVEIDKDLPVYGVKTVQQMLASSTVWQRFYAQLLGTFAAVALLLAAIGIYGAISYSVTERSHEIGLRITLGAQAGQVLGLVLKEGLILSLVGVAIGLADSFGTTPLISSLLYGVKAHDPLTLALVSLFLIGVTILATYIPARRAARVDPMVTLRHE